MSPRWTAILPVTVALLAAAAIGFGVRQALRAPAEPVPDTPDAPAGGPTPVAGAKRPAAFGLPEFPGAFEFSSMETDAGIGSCTYAVRARETHPVVRFYTLELGKAGWDLVWRRRAVMRTSPREDVPPLRGTRVRWGHREKRRQLTLLTTHNPHRQVVHVVLTWSPMQVEGAAPEEAPPTLP
jgi:hypothetical protein